MNTATLHEDDLLDLDSDQPEEIEEQDPDWADRLPVAKPYAPEEYEFDDEATNDVDIEETAEDEDEPCDAVDDEGLEAASPDDLQIDAEFEDLIPRMTNEEYRELERNILCHGCRDRIATWGPDHIVLDGHNRLKICRKHSIPYQTTTIELADREAARQWILENQLGRRNLTSEQRDYLRGKLYTAEKAAHGGARPRAVSTAKTQQMTTAEKIAKRTKVSSAKVRSDAKYAKDLDQIASEEGGTKLKQLVLSGESGLRQKDITNIAKMPPDERKLAVEKALAASKNGKKTKTEAKKSTSTPKTPPTKEAKAAHRKRIELLPEFEKAKLLTYGKNSSGLPALERLCAGVLKAARSEASKLHTEAMKKAGFDAEVVAMALTKQMQSIGISELFQPG